MELLEHFRSTRADLVFVVDEYGAVQGVISERDLLEAITGEFGTPSDEDSWAVQRDDGSWLMDGLIPVPELKDRLEIKELPEEDRGRYNTLAGMVMLLLGRLPRTADRVEWQGWAFEVVDLDGKRVDKVLVTRTEQPGEERVINQNLHRQPVPLDNVAHRNLKVQMPVLDWTVASRLNSIFLAAVEFGDACREFPIVFIRAGNGDDGKPQIAPVAVFGLANEENLFVDGTQWRATYMPAVLRLFPFAIGRIDAQNFAVCVDTAWQGLSTTEGHALFDQQGQPTDVMKQVTEQAERTEQEVQRTRLVGQRLLELDLFREMRFDVTMPDGQNVAVEGFFTIDEGKAQGPARRGGDRAHPQRPDGPGARPPDLAGQHAPAGRMAATAHGSARAGLPGPLSLPAYLRLEARCRPGGTAARSASHARRATKCCRSIV